MKINLATAGIIILVGLLAVSIYSTIQFQASGGHGEKQEIHESTETASSQAAGTEQTPRDSEATIQTPTNH